MPLIAVALTYGSFGDTKETLALAYRLYATLRGRGEPSGEIKEVLEVSKNFYDDTATLMKYLETNSSVNSSPKAQRIFDGMAAEMCLRESLMQKLYTRTGQSNGVLTRIWLALSEERALAAWRAEMVEHRTLFHMHLQSLLAIISKEGRQQLEGVASRVQYIEPEVGRKERTDQTLQVPNGLGILLCQKEGWGTSTGAGLPETE